MTLGAQAACCANPRLLGFCAHTQRGLSLLKLTFSKFDFQEHERHSGSNSVPSGLMFRRGSSLTPKDTSRFPGPLSRYGSTAHLTRLPWCMGCSDSLGSNLHPYHLPRFLQIHLSHWPQTHLAAMHVWPHHSPPPVGYKLSSAAGPHHASPPLAFYAMVTHSFTPSMASLLFPLNATPLPPSNPRL